MNKQNMKKYFILHLAFLSAILLSLPINAQPDFDRQDTLRGSNTRERAWWDLNYYHLEVNVDPETQSLEGKNTIQYTVLDNYSLMQIDLQEPLTIDQVVQDGQTLKVDQEGSAWFVMLNKKQSKGAVNELEVYYSGKPKVAVRPPWDGGITWVKDSQGKPFIANANQGIGASIWWPCKDHPADEPDSMLISITVPEGLMDVSNGRLRTVEENEDQTKTYHWFVDNPINNYGVNLSVADYAHFSETYEGEKGDLDCHYYVLKENLDKAKEQFKQVSMMLEAFEHWFGPYPFYEDGFKLVEVPYLGMEHQSAVTYGNGYENGYRGSDLSDSGWGLEFDFIIIHEAGHEWFANNITYQDVADMWIHESFTNYSESLYVEYHYGKEAGAAYVRGTRSRISNDRPIIGVYGVNRRGSGDMYYKGGNMLHTLRQIINDDDKWRSILRGLNETFYHQTVTSEQVESYIAEQAGLELNYFFNQYLRDVRIPILEYYVKDDSLFYRWGNCVSGFSMPLKVKIGEKEHWLKPSTRWSEGMEMEGNSDLEVDVNFYVGAMKITE
jgi:aminopeptidase N